MSSQNIFTRKGWRSRRIAGYSFVQASRDLVFNVGVFEDAAQYFSLTRINKWVMQDARARKRQHGFLEERF